MQFYARALKKCQPDHPPEHGRHKQSKNERQRQRPGDDAPAAADAPAG